MKKFITILIVSFSLISCSVSEEVFFNADGSGKMAYTIDMSKMLELTKDIDKKNAKKMSKDLVEGAEKDMDSTIAFKDIPAKYKKKGKELTPEQLANIEQMKNSYMRMVVNKAKNEMKYTVYTDFKNISEVNNVNAMLTAMQLASGKKSNAAAGPSLSSDSDVKFVLDGKKFSREVIEKPVVEEIEEDYLIEEYDEEAVDTAEAVVYDDVEEVESKENAEEDVEMTDAELKKMEDDFKKMGELMKKGMDESYFNFQYSFPKKIKKVSLPKSSYKLSDDKKTIIIKYQMEEFTKNVKDLNLIIEFE